MSAPPPAATRWFSLRRRLLTLLLGGMSAGWLVIVGMTYYDAHHEVDELLDAQMGQVAQTLLAMASEYEDDDDIAELEAGDHKYQKKFVFQIWDDAGRLLLRSRHAPLTPLATADGFTDAAEGKHRWRLYSQWDRERKLRVQVGEDHHVREEITGHIVGRMLGLILLGLPLLGAWAWFATRRGLASIDVVAGQVASRAPEHLDPLTPTSAPTELRPLIEAINQLFARVEHTLDGERRFTADAAHELRTPLAAIATQAQVALRARDAAERDHAIGQLAVGARRAGHLLEQLLTLARLDPQAGLPTAAVRLDTLAAEACADQGAVLLEKSHALDLAADQPVTVVANEAMLRVLLRNLLDNAVRYTPPGGRIRVATGLDAGQAVLEISDSGPGIAAAARQPVLQRFHRLAGQEIEGSGLGLSIVARIVELHGARLELGDGLAGATTTGLMARVIFRA